MIGVGYFAMALAAAAGCVWYVGRSSPTTFFDWAEEKLRYCIKRHKRFRGHSAVIYIIGCLALVFLTFERQTRPGKFNLIFTVLAFETAAELANPDWPDVVLGGITLIKAMADKYLTPAGN